MPYHPSDIYRHITSVHEAADTAFPLSSLAQSGEPLKRKCVSSRGLNPTLCSKVSQNLFPPTSSHRNSM